jgi:hypothetical protein
MAARRRRRIAAIAVSGLVHLAVLAVVAMQAPTLFIPFESGGPPEPVIPVLLTPRLPPTAAAPGERPDVIRLHRRQLRAPPPELPVAPLPVPAARPAPTPAPAAPAAASRAAVLPEGPREALRATLRRSPIGCANAGAAGLSREEREACEERFGAGSKAAPFIPAPIAPEIRTYYDEVAKAKAPDGPPTPQRAPGSLGMFDGANVGMKGHGPAVGCHVALGPGGGVRRPPHGMKLGPLPCYVVPPAGSLSPDVDVVNPDTVVKHGPTPP